MTDAMTKIDRAKDLLEPPVVRPRAWPALLAAGATAVSAVMLAGMVILGPGL